ncbi:MAG TPA: ribosome silencing factor [Pyrinomonadaceae bacterium]|jgi:iojap-like ribosome-associated protein|nr:ribosome silencing factor [Pyrinomonadaceae bacterium]
MKTNSTAKEQSLNPQPVVRPQQQVAGAEDQLDERVLAALHAAADKKALDVVVLDLREIASFTDFFVITSGANERQVQAISDEVYESLKKAGSKAARVEGYKTAEWILLDYGDFIVHVFEQKARQFYDLERLWRESKRVELPPGLFVDSGSLRRES